MTLWSGSLVFFVAFIATRAHVSHADKKVPSMDQAIEAAAQKSSDLDMMQDDNTILVELDMRFTPEQWAEIQASRENEGNRQKRNALRSSQMRWTNAQVPYTMTGGFSARDRQQIQAGINEWNKYSCVNIRRATSRDTASVRVVPRGGCSSMVGMTRRRGQTLTLGPGCRYKGVVAHEFGHALGFHHEQTRPDRDRYVRILTQNIRPYARFNFKRYDWGMINSYSVPYDYRSIMHYGQYAFSRNGQTTIQTIDRKAQKLIGNRYGVSFYDIKLINLMYSCNRRCNPTKRCPGSGFQGKDCRCWCQGPSAQKPVIDCITKRPIGGGNVVGPKPTQRPNPGKKGKGNLRDFHPKCSSWARSGECKRNPGYMLINCKYSCSKVRGTVRPVSRCVDKNRNCMSWRGRGYCRYGTFRRYMSLNCRRACGYCRASSTPRRQQSPQSSPGNRRRCFNRNRFCESWKRLGNCYNYYRGYMRINCPKSCGVC